MGWQPDYGLGRGIKTGNSGGAGGYGGKGGAGGAGGAGGNVYPHPFRPVLPGSGGSLSGNYGGGALLFVLAGRAQIDGTLSADGGAARGYYGGGSGGSIFLRCRTFSGGTKGVMTAAGGNGGTRGGGGGGGRIAVLMGLTDKDADALLLEPPPGHLIITTRHHRFAGSASAAGGLPGTSGGAGLPGSVYFVQPTYGTLLIIQ
jgi:hypothetical protein